MWVAKELLACWDVWNVPGIQIFLYPGQQRSEITEITTFGMCLHLDDIVAIRFQSYTSQCCYLHIKVIVCVSNFIGWTRLNREADNKQRLFEGVQCRMHFEYFVLLQISLLSSTGMLVYIFSLANWLALGQMAGCTVNSISKACPSKCSSVVFSFGLLSRQFQSEDLLDSHPTRELFESWPEVIFDKLG